MVVTSQFPVREFAARIISDGKYVDRLMEWSIDRTDGTGESRRCSGLVGLAHALMPGNTHEIFRKVLVCRRWIRRRPNVDGFPHRDGVGDVVLGRNDFLAGRAIVCYRSVTW